MNQDRFAGIWKQFRGKVTHNPLVVTTGTRDQLAGRIQGRYGVLISKEKAANQLKYLLGQNRNWDLSNR